jgi:hypothetical protein
MPSNIRTGFFAGAASFACLDVSRPPTGEGELERVLPPMLENYEVLVVEDREDLSRWEQDC